MHRNKNCFVTKSKEYKIETKYVLGNFLFPLVLIKLITEESGENSFVLSK